jgi:integrase
MSDYRITKHRKKWALTTGSGPTLSRRSTGTADRDVAEVVARKMWLALQGPPSERVRDLWKIYIQDRQADSKDTSRQQQVWKNLEPTFGDKLGNQITREECRSYATTRKRMGVSASTINTELSYLRACLNLKYGKGNNKVWVPSPSAPREHYLTKDQAETLINAAKSPHIKLFIILALATGARMSSILELTWAQIDFKHRLIRFNAADRDQTNKRRPEIRMNDRAYNALTEAAKGALTDYVIEYAREPVKSVKRAIRNLSEATAVPCSPHVFRHTAGVWMANADVPMEKISQYLGHTTTRITERHYARYSPSFMQDAAAALEF